MRLLVGDHLQPVLDRPEPVVAGAEQQRVGAIDDPGFGQCVERRAGAAPPEFGSPPAVDHLVRLREEFDLADPAAALLEVEAGAGAGRSGIVGADLLRQPRDLGNRPEIEAAPPHERPDRGEEAFACGHVARAGAGADEGGAFPGQCRAFVMRQRRADGQRERGDLARGPQPQVDPEDIAVLGHVAHDLHQRARHPLRRLARFVADPAWQQFGIVEQDRIDVGRVVKLARAVLAQRQREEARRLGTGHTLGNCRGDSAAERAVGELAELGHDPGQREGSGKVTDSQRQRQRALLAAKRDARFIETGPGGLRPGKRFVPFARCQQCREVGQTFQPLRKIRRMAFGAGDG